jgi:hypothetical protein
MDIIVPVYARHGRLFLLPNFCNKLFKYFFYGARAADDGRASPSLRFQLWNRKDDLSVRRQYCYILPYQYPQADRSAHEAELKGLSHEIEMG